MLSNIMPSCSLEPVILDFSLDDIMRMSVIRRWAIIDMARDQSVAEHSYNVAMICLAILNGPLCGYFIGDDRFEVVMWALCHDLPEIDSGDIPTPMKSWLKSDIEEMETVKYRDWTHEKSSIPELMRCLVKVADSIDAIIFCKKYCIDHRKHDILDEMGKRLIVSTEKLDDLVKENDPQESWRSTKNFIRNMVNL
jgi:5'-deoxynucleotidase